MSLEHQIEELKLLVSALQREETIFEKLDLLNSLPLVQDYLFQSSSLQTFLTGLAPECDFVIKSIIAIGQGPVVLNMHQLGADRFTLLRSLIQQLLDIEHFYQDLGGIIGYHLTVLNLIINQDHEAANGIQKESRYIHPEGFHLNYSSEIRKAIRLGIEHLDQLAEIYPVGGAGDRLNLIDELTGIALPAAMLPFTGISLLEGLIRDLQAREYLYFKLHGKQIVIPIAMMTSGEKNNHNQIITICKRKNWFGRSPESFFFFIQPLVPVITIEGNWSLSAPLTLMLKPGGHGVIWKLAETTGVFSWLALQKRHKSLIRQINNPLAGLDCTLLALTGIGLYNQKTFGFASCERLLQSAEGTNVLIETKTDKGFAYCLTNIEYTDFAKKGIGETPAHPGSPFSIYPTNTNILFIDIPTIQRTLKQCPLPGKLINMKSKVPYLSPEGHVSYIQGGRLESTMQNIADCLIDEFPYQIQNKDVPHALQTFITYSQRIKTISTTKKSYKKGESLVATPEQAYYDLLTNHLTLLKKNCQFTCPALPSVEDYLEKGPNCIVLYHPALGPLYSIIAQKLRKGRLAERSELQLEIAEIDIEELDVEGSACIESINPLGHYDEQGLLKYGQESRCLLHHVTIRNRGINWNASNCFWKNQIFHHESLYILLHEASEFQAEHVTFEGDFFFEVPAYHRLIIKQDKQGKLLHQLERIQRPSWYWNYLFNTEDQVELKKVLNY